MTPPASRDAATSPRAPPARAALSHRVGAAAVPNSAYTVVNGNTGSGFHDGPPLIAKLRCGSTTSRPQEIHDHGSYDGTVGNTAAESAANTTHTTVELANG